MGFNDAAAEISEEREYIGKERSLLSLAAVTLNGKAIVHDA